jgi:hypothetical protein
MLVRDEDAIIEFDGDDLLNLNKFGIESVRFPRGDENDPSYVSHRESSPNANLEDSRSKINESLTLSKSFFFF